MKAHTSGLVVLNKPRGITSRAALNQLQHHFRARRWGHAGTLDPAASGVLVVACGQATRLVGLVQEMRKHYDATIRFGVRSASHDGDTPLQTGGDVARLTHDAVRVLCGEFTGTILQTPPLFSAVKVNGRRAHEIARAGEHAELKPRTVTVYEFRCTGFDGESGEFSIECSSGTYVRSLARDLGERLATGAVLTHLARTRIGPFCIEHACSLQNLPPSIEPILRPTSDAASQLPRIDLDANDTAFVRHGRPISLSGTATSNGADRLALFANDSLLAIGRLDRATNRVRPEIVLTDERK